MSYTYGSNDYSNFIPEVWVKELLLNFDKTCVMRNIVNTNYQGEIRGYGDVVRIPGAGSVTVSSYTRGGTLTPSATTTTETQLLINQAASFVFEVDRLDEAQSQLDIVSIHTARAAVELQNYLDSLLLAEYLNAHHAIGTDTVPINLATEGVSAYKNIVDMTVLFKEHHVNSPISLVIPPRIAGIIQKESYFVNAYQSGDGGAMMRTGNIGSIAGVQIYVSSNLVAIDPATSALGADIFPCLFLTKDAISFAMQVTEISAAKPHNTFSTWVKGLVSFGYKTVYPTNLGVWKVNATTI